jgi:hypothetical protein
VQVLTSASNCREAELVLIASNAEGKQYEGKGGRLLLLLLAEAHGVCARAGQSQEALLYQKLLL